MNETSTKENEMIDVECFLKGQVSYALRTTDRVRQILTNNS